MTASDSKVTVSPLVTGDSPPYRGCHCHLSPATPNTLRPTDRTIPGDLVRIPIGKGCFIALTKHEFCNGIFRGKTLMRRELFRKRQKPRKPAPLPLFKEAAQ